MLELKSPPDRDFWVICAKCARSTCHRAVTQVAQHDSTPEVSWWNNYFVIRCEGCHEVSFLHQSGSDDDWIDDPETGEAEPAVAQQVYPQRVAGIRALSESYALPWNVRSVYSETLAAINSDLPILAGAGIRAIVEAVATHQNAKGNNLERRIDDLRSKGFITPIEAELLHDLRFMGNASMHETKWHTQEELAAALRIVDHLLTGVYVLARSHRSRKADA